MVLNAAILSASNFTRLTDDICFPPERSATWTGHWNLVNIQEWLECEPLPSPTVFGKTICHVWPTEFFPLYKESPPPFVLTGHISSRISAAACIHFPPMRLKFALMRMRYVPISGCTFWRRYWLIKPKKPISDRAGGRKPLIMLRDFAWGLVDWVRTKEDGKSNVLPRIVYKLKDCFPPLHSTSWLLKQ